MKQLNIVEVVCCMGGEKDPLVSPTARKLLVCVTLLCECLAVSAVLLYIYLSTNFPSPVTMTSSTRTPSRSKLKGEAYRQWFFVNQLPVEPNYPYIQSMECSLLKEAESNYRYTETSTASPEDQQWSGLTPSHLPPNEVQKQIIPQTVDPTLDENLGQYHQEGEETEFTQYWSEHREEFASMSGYSFNDPKLDEWKQKMNNKNFVLNSDKFDMSTRQDHDQHLPIWLRVHTRVDPLSNVLEQICQVHNIEKSILYVTVDGTQFFWVLNLLRSFDCIKTRIYFHAFSNNLKNYLGPKFREEFLAMRTTKLVTHAMYGLNLLFNKFKYPYVITLEDDIGPLPDFYNYHLSLYKLTLEDSVFNPYYSVTAYAHGVQHNCKYISTTLYQEGLILSKIDDPSLKECRFQDLDQLVIERYHAIWGSGIPRKVFNRLWNVWTKAVFNPEENYLGTLLRDLRKPHEKIISPCSNRITRFENHGENGNDARIRFWTLAFKPCTRYQSTEQVKNWKPDDRKYKVVNEFA